jgi:very-short-patch-repair endonuclease
MTNMNFNILEKNKIKYCFNKSLKDCISSSRLRFDFYLPDYNICIEFDGPQHFKPIDFFGGEEEFNKTKLRDSIKNQWCEVNRIKLLRLNYLQSKDHVEDVLTEEIIANNPDKGSKLILDYNKEDDKMFVSIKKTSSKKKKTDE